MEEEKYKQSEGRRSEVGEKVRRARSRTEAMKRGKDKYGQEIARRNEIKPSDVGAASKE